MTGDIYEKIESIRYLNPTWSNFNVDNFDTN